MVNSGAIVRHQNPPAAAGCGNRNSWRTSCSKDAKKYNKKLDKNMILMENEVQTGELCRSKLYLAHVCLLPIRYTTILRGLDFPMFRFESSLVYLFQQFPADRPNQCRRGTTCYVWSISRDNPSNRDCFYVLTSEAISAGSRSRVQGPDTECSILYEVALVGDRRSTRQLVCSRSILFYL